MTAVEPPQVAPHPLESLQVEPPQVRVRYWAAARAAAGVSDEQVEGADLARVLATVRERHPEPAFSRLLAACSLLVDGAPVGRRDPASIALAPAATVEVLPPFAGGSTGSSRG